MIDSSQQISMQLEILSILIYNKNNWSALNKTSLHFNPITILRKIYMLTHLKWDR